MTNHSKVDGIMYVVYQQIDKPDLKAEVWLCDNSCTHAEFVRFFKPLGYSFSSCGVLAHDGKEWLAIHETNLEENGDAPSVYPPLEKQTQLACEKAMEKYEKDTVLMARLHQIMGIKPTCIQKAGTVDKRKKPYQKEFGPLR